MLKMNILLCLLSFVLARLHKTLSHECHFNGKRHRHNVHTGTMGLQHFQDKIKMIRFSVTVEIILRSRSGVMFSHKIKH